MLQLTQTEIWNRYGEQLALTVNSKVTHAEHRKDILQDIYLKIGLNLGKVRKADNTIAYLTRIAHNVIADFFRKHQCVCLPEQSLGAKEIAFIPKNEQPSPLADCCLRPMIESLPPIYREALILTDLEGLSQKELSGRLGISLPGAKSRVQRGRQKLKEIIGHCCEYSFDKWGNILECKPKNKCVCRQ